jgi:semaphorin 5
MKLLLQNDTIVSNVENHIIYWEPSQDTDIECRRSVSYTHQSKICHNFVRILLVDQQNKKLLTCGTNANKPVCTWRNLNQLDHVVERLDGLGKCPQSPDSSLSYLSLLNGDIYFATSIDYSAQGMKPDYLIDRGLGPSRQIRTDQYNSNWLNEPEFVASIEVDDYVYFFMRETAIEYMNCGQKVYSRVARLCKHDQGTENFDVWKTFEKARLNCSVPANNLTDHFKSSNIYQSAEQIHQYAYSFDEIQNVYFDKKKNLIYAIFSTPL